MMRISAPLEYEGRSFTAELLRRDLEEFGQVYEFSAPQYDWQWACYRCDMSEDMAFLFTLKYPRYQGHFKHI